MASASRLAMDSVETGEARKASVATELGMDLEPENVGGGPKSHVVVT